MHGDKTKLATRELLKGKLPKEIVREFGIDSSSIRNAARKMGMPPFKRGRARGHICPHIPAAILLRRGGATLKAIGLKFGVTKQRVSQWLKP